MSVGGIAGQSIRTTSSWLPTIFFPTATPPPCGWRSAPGRSVCGVSGASGSSAGDLRFGSLQGWYRFQHHQKQIAERGYHAFRDLGLWTIIPPSAAGPEDIVAASCFSVTSQKGVASHSSCA